MTEKFNVIKALELLSEGYPVRKIDWDSREYLRVDKNGNLEKVILVATIVGSKPKPISTCIDTYNVQDIIENQWEKANVVTPGLFSYANKGREEILLYNEDWYTWVSSSNNWLKLSDSVVDGINTNMPNPLSMIKPGLFEPEKYSVKTCTTIHKEFNVKVV